jgi:hypothetical protein
MVLCCVVAAAAVLTPFFDHSAIVYPEGLEESNAENRCNDLVGLENEGFLIVGSNNDHSCVECHRIVDRPDGCLEGERKGGVRAVGRKKDDPNRRDGCYHKAGRGYECLACTGRQAFGPISPLTSAIIHISSDCHHVEPGGEARIQLNRTMADVTLLGHGGVALLDEFPAHVGPNFAAKDVTFKLLTSPPTTTTSTTTTTTTTEAATTEDVVAARANKPARKNKKKVARAHARRFRSALIAQEDGRILLEDAHAPEADALVTIRPPHPRFVDVKLTKASIRGSARLFVAAVSHVTVPDNTVQIFCTDPENRVATQQLQNDRPLIFAPFPPDASDATTTTTTTTTRTGTTTTLSPANVFAFNDGTNCSEPLDVAKLLAIYGKHYEVEFFNEGEFQQEVDPWLKSSVRYLVFAVVILSATLFLGHEGDARRMYRYLVLHKKLHHE